jgi:hypothetical protein
MFHTLILCTENIFHTHIYKKMKNQCDINFYISLYFIYKCINLWMNKFCTIFIINLLHVKFVMLMINIFPMFYDLIFFIFSTWQI